MSFIPMRVAARPDARRRSTHRCANSSALPVCEAQATTIGEAGSPPANRNSSTSPRRGGHARTGPRANRRATPAWRAGTARTPATPGPPRPGRCAGRRADRPDRPARRRRTPVRPARRFPGRGQTVHRRCLRFAGSGADATFVKDTAHALNSGCCDAGSIASLVTALIARYSPWTSFQWNGANAVPGSTRSVTTAGSTAFPRRDAISTRSPSVIEYRCASSGLISTNGPGSSLLSLATFPVFVRVCHWCCTRPVFSTMGWSASGISAGSMCGRAKNIARPLPVAKARRGTVPSSRTSSERLVPSLR